MVTDPVADMLSQIKNAMMARHKSVSVPYSKFKEAIAQALKNEGYLQSVDTQGEVPKQKLSLALTYQSGVPLLTDIKRKSKPGLRVYVGASAIPKVLGGMGVSIVSTPEGIMSGAQARKRRLGGELICEVW